MSYDIAQFKYINHMREHYGLIGEPEYPSRARSHQDENGNWVLISPQGLKMAKILILVLVKHHLLAQCQKKDGVNNEIRFNSNRI